MGMLVQFKQGAQETFFWDIWADTEMMQKANHVTIYGEIFPGR